MAANIRIDGIYDLKTFEILFKEGIRNYSFDFRPRSFNFIQEYKVLEFLNSELAPEARFFLHFESATDVAIEKFLHDFRKETAFLEGLFQKLVLEFSDHQNLEQFDKFHVPFIWHWKAGTDYKRILESKNLMGVVIDYEQVVRMNKGNLLDEFYKKVCADFIPQLKKRGGEVFLAANWPQIIDPALLEFLPVDFYAFPLNSQVELSYRVLHYPTLREKIFELQQLFNI